MFHICYALFMLIVYLVAAASTSMNMFQSNATKNPLVFLQAMIVAIIGEVDLILPHGPLFDDDGRLFNQFFELMENRV